MQATQQLQTYVQRMSPEQYSRLIAFAETLVDTTPANLSDVTETLRQRIEHAFPEALRRRLRELTTKSENETLSEIEREEYIALAEQREDADAARLQAVQQLARLRAVPFAQVLNEFGIGVNGRG